MNEKQRESRPAMREQTTLRLPAELKEKLNRKAKENGISLNAMILTILYDARQRQG